MLFFFLLFYLYITFYEVCSREQMEVRPTGKGCIEIEVPYFNFSWGGGCPKRFFFSLNWKVMGAGEV